MSLGSLVKVANLVSYPARRFFSRSTHRKNPLLHMVSSWFNNLHDYFSFDELARSIFLQVCSILAKQIKKVLTAKLCYSAYFRVSEDITLARLEDFCIGSPGFIASLRPS